MKFFLILLLGVFTGLNCGDFGNQHGGPKINEGKKTSRAETQPRPTLMPKPGQPLRQAPVLMTISRPGPAPISRLTLRQASAIPTPSSRPGATRTSEQQLKAKFPGLFEKYKKAFEQLEQSRQNQDSLNTPQKATRPSSIVKERKAEPKKEEQKAPREEIPLAPRPGARLGITVRQALTSIPPLRPGAIPKASVPCSFTSKAPIMPAPRPMSMPMRPRPAPIPEATPEVSAPPITPKVPTTPVTLSVVIATATATDIFKKATSEEPYKAYISSYSSTKYGVGRGVYDLQGLGCYYNNPEWHYCVSFEKPVSQEVSNEYSNFILKHGKYVYLGKRMRSNGNARQFRTTMNYEQFQALVAKANEEINKVPYVKPVIQHDIKPSVDVQPINKSNVNIISIKAGESIARGEIRLSWL